MRESLLLSVFGFATLPVEGLDQLHSFGGFKNCSHPISTPSLYLQVRKASEGAPPLCRVPAGQTGSCVGAALLKAVPSALVPAEEARPMGGFSGHTMGELMILVLSAPFRHHSLGRRDPGITLGSCEHRTCVPGNCPTNITDYSYLNQSLPLVDREKAAQREAPSSPPLGSCQRLAQSSAAQHQACVHLLCSPRYPSSWDSAWCMVGTQGNLAN